MNSVSVSVFDPPRHDGSQALTVQIADMIRQKLSQLGVRPGSRMPSIRLMAQHLGVSRFTIVETYNRLADEGWLQARQGAGCFVQARKPPPRDDGAMPGTDGLSSPCEGRPMDVSWLLHGLLRDVGNGAIPGSSALLPAEWLDAGLLASATRAVGRSPCTSLLGYGSPQGHGPLRHHLARHLQTLDIPAHPDHNLLLTSGVTHAVDLVLRALTQPGDTVLVEDPAWFLVFGRLAAAGVRALPVPRTPSGPDLQVLANMAREHRPRLFIINSAIHNPTGYTLSAQSAFHVLQLAQQHDFHLFEDDTYGDLHPSSPIRLAAMDGLQRVLFSGGFSKTLAAGLRVAYLAGPADLIRPLTDLKLLSGLTTPEINERILLQILSSGQYRRHLERVRGRVDLARGETLRRLHVLGVTTQADPAGGMFVWGDCGQDSEHLSRMAANAGMLLAPGALFSPTQQASSHVRFSVTLAENPAAWKILETVLRG